MAWYGKLSQLFRKKRLAPSTPEERGKAQYNLETRYPQYRKSRDVLAPTARTQKAIKDLKASGLSDKQINRLLYGRE